MTLTENINSLNSRVGALESNGLDENAGIARITKIYNGVKITCTVTTRVNTSLTPSAGLYPGDDIFNEITIL